MKSDSFYHALGENQMSEDPATPSYATLVDWLLELKSLEKQRCRKITVTLFS